MSISSITGGNFKPSFAPQPAQTNQVKPRDPDHDGDVDKASNAVLGDNDKAASGNSVNIKV